MFNLEMDLVGIEELEADIVRADGVLVDVVAESVDGALRDGAEHAKQNHGYQDRTGALTASIVGRVDSQNASGASGVLEATVPYASYVEEGTDAHTIEASGKALHWEGAGGEHFAQRVNHPGSSPKPFMKPAQDYAADRLKERLEAGIAARVAPILEK